MQSTSKKAQIKKKEAANQSSKAADFLQNKQYVNDHRFKDAVSSVWAENSDNPVLSWKRAIYIYTCVSRFNMCTYSFIWTGC